jgi:hypothetical protein
MHADIIVLSGEKVALDIACFWPPGGCSLPGAGVAAENRSPASLAVAVAVAAAAADRQTVLYGTRVEGSAWV